MLVNTTPRVYYIFGIARDRANPASSSALQSLDFISLYLSLLPHRHSCSKFPLNSIYTSRRSPPPRGVVENLNFKYSGSITCPRTHLASFASVCLVLGLVNSGWSTWGEDVVKDFPLDPFRTCVCVGVYVGEDLR